MRLTYYNAYYLSRYQGLPGMKPFLAYIRAYTDPTTAPVDRSGVLRFPVRVRSLFPIPAMEVCTKTYEELCNERARQLLARAGRLDVPIYVFWSGGVDSTCALVSLLKLANSADRERIVVLMSEESIAEYPEFYRKHIRAQLRRESADLFPYIFGTQRLVVNGEHNDQLFGSDIMVKVTKRFGFDVIHQPYDRRLFITFFTGEMDGNEVIARAYVDLFERLCEGAPIPLSSNYSRFWWINFAVKWQTVYLRALSFTAKRNADLITVEYLRTLYAPFFNTPAFQLWSMNNPDQRIRDSWASYKWPAKAVIYEFAKDADYRDKKRKRGSLQFLTSTQVPFNFIDDKFGFHQDIKPEVFYDEKYAVSA